MKIIKLLEKYFAEIIAILVGTFFGLILMFSTFSKTDGILFISSKAWSDFASHIPLIRSFSLGSNLPPEYPLFAGPIIKYHFGFYFGVGLLEKIGIPIDLALNIPSLIGFVLLIFIIFYFAKKVFKSNAVGFLSIIFFLFNSSLSFIYYFQKNSISIKSITNIPFINHFQSFAPYDDGVISAFWNLNIYTNQRHLPLSFAISLILILIIINPLFNKKKVDYKLSIILGFILGLTFFLHFAVLVMTASTIFFLGLLYKKIRKSTFILLLTAGLVSLPQYIYINSGGNSSLALKLGYLISENLNLLTFTEFWIYNLGLSLILIPVGFYFASKFQRKMLISVLPLFIIGNMFQFSPEIAANHKFFNYILIFGNMFSAFALYILWQKKNIFKPIVIVALFLMIFGGIIDFFPIANDKKVSIPDYELNSEANWLMKNTPADSVFLNTTLLYNSASLAGRKVFYGWPYFAWSQGYDTKSRKNEYEKMLEATDINILCVNLIKNKIDYVEIKVQKPKNPDIPSISNLWHEKFIASYKNEDSSYAIYDVDRNCK